MITEFILTVDLQRKNKQWCFIILMLDVIN